VDVLKYTAVTKIKSSMLLTCVQLHVLYILENCVKSLKAFIISKMYSRTLC